ncbi:NUDIX hydrolase [Branchiibius cervicis]|uniref:NUDIX hydrolase n=1 Tax=Branchiibius cervicis TaxID=908252 RepID=A0ABW2ARP4_9MICO
MNDASEEPVRTLIPVPANERPRRTRRTARVLLLDEQDRVLLFTDTDPGMADSRWWITPGGGIEDGESEQVAAVREVAEETGLQLRDDQLFGPLMVRHVVHGYTDVVIDQHDTFFFARVPQFEISTAGHTQEERITMVSWSWWSEQELRQTAEIVWPIGLLELLQEIARFEVAADRSAYPVDYGSVEESTVPGVL